MSTKLWAVTAYFAFDDPQGKKRRLSLFRQFQQHLQVPLVAAELAPDGSFDLTEEDADILIQCRDGDFLWQKGALLNRAIRSLPPECDTVAWLDCDIILTRPDWAEAARLELDRGALLVQPFRSMLYLETPYWPGNARQEQGGEWRDSFAYRYVQGSIPDQIWRSVGLSQTQKYAPGMAWVARRDLLETAGLYDAGILGTGDKLIYSAACGRQSDTIHALGMHQAFGEHFRAWADSFQAAVRGRLGFVEGDLLHLWHGDLSARGYSSRYQGLREHGFDPATDLRRAASGCWRWASPKAAMHDYVRRQFEMRATSSVAVTA